MVCKGVEEQGGVGEAEDTQRSATEDAVVAQMDVMKWNLNMWNSLERT